MSFTARIILGNAAVVFITVTIMMLLGPKNATHFMVGGTVGLVLIIGSSAILALLCRIAFAPLANVTNALEKAANGDLSVRVPAEGFGEIARLGSALNTMMADINKA